MLYLFQGKCTFAFVEKNVLHFIDSNQLFFARQKVILAVSGGKDSMALWHLLNTHHFKVVVVHCNFKLRGAESDTDEAFVKAYAQKSDTPFHAFTFDTENYANKNKISIQEAARELRYTCFEDIRKEENATAIVTAHHLDDNIETLIHKLVKGTGVKGIRAMLPKQGRIVRPLLTTSVESIKSYIDAHQIPFREDASNASVKYDRNKIRHEVTPILKELNTGYYKSFAAHFERWQAIENLYDSTIDLWRKKLLKQKQEDIIISKLALLKIKGIYALLFELLNPYGFNNSVTNDVLKSLETTESKVFFSSSHRLLIDKKFLVITPISQLESSVVHLLNETDKKVVFKQGILRFHNKPIAKHSKLVKNINTAYIDTAKLSYPLELRKWKPGDYFYPLGFVKKSGKPSKKKLSKYFKDEKVSIRDKENTWVLVSGDKIVWVVGQRLDHRFRITDKTEKLCVLKFLPE